MAVFQTIYTARLVLRKLETTDAPAFFKYRSMPEVFEYQTFKPKNTKETEAFIGGIAESPNVPGTWFQLAVCLKDNNRLIGDIGIHFLEDGQQAEIGYTIAPGFQGCGYAAEGVEAVLDYLFNGLGKHRVTASVDPGNEKSVRLLNKTGFRKEAHFIKSLNIGGVWFDDFVYALLKEEWKA